MLFETMNDTAACAWIYGRMWLAETCIRSAFAIVVNKGYAQYNNSQSAHKKLSGPTPPYSCGSLPLASSAANAVIDVGVCKGLLTTAAMSLGVVGIDTGCAKH